METETTRVKKLIQNNNFTNDSNYNQRGKENIVFEAVLEVNFDKNEFWKYAKNNGLSEDDVCDVKGILSDYNIVLKTNCTI